MTALLHACNQNAVNLEGQLPSITERFSYNKSPLNAPHTFMRNSMYIYLKYKIRKNVSILISWITYSPLQLRRLQTVPPPPLL